MTSHSKHCMWVKFDRTFCGLNKDLYLGIIYIRHITSVQCREQLFKQLEKDIIKYRTMGGIFVNGDFKDMQGQGISLTLLLKMIHQIDMMCIFQIFMYMTNI